MKRHLLVLAIATLASAGGTGHAQIVMDGSKDAAYGAALSVQTTNTQFGNATNGDPINGGGGSEIDAIYATVSGGRLHIMVTGNLQTNFDKLEVFIDSETGGINTINSSNYIEDPLTGNPRDDWHNLNTLPNGVDGFCCGGFPAPNGGNTENEGALQRMHGLTFDAGFNADHYITISHGFESALTPNLGFYASSAHYADLTDGAAGRSGALGMQLAQKGLPRVLRGTTADFNVDGDADGGDFLTWQANFGLVEANAPTRAMGNADGDDDPGAATNRDVDGNDFNIWQSVFGFDVDGATFGNNYFAPQSTGVDNSNVLLGPALPGLAQGELIDKVYAFGPGGATNNAGTGAITRELEFVLPVATAGNPESHRNFENIVDLLMAIDNSNIAGVDGGGGAATGNPGDVTTGFEFSIPLSEIGTSAGAGAIKLMVFINGNVHDYASNQFSGAGVLQGNLGGDGFGAFTGALHDNDSTDSIDLTQVLGDQFVTVFNAVAVAGAVPEPGTGALVVATLSVGLAARRRRS